MTKENMSGIFANAVDSIKMGIEDYALDTPARALSAVRNFYAGVLLLGKEVLIRAAPLADPNDVIGAKYIPVPDGMGGVVHKVEGYQTVDFTTLSKRFQDFEIPIDTKGLQWSCPHQTGQGAWLADCAAMNSRGERMRKPL